MNDTILGSSQKLDAMLRAGKITQAEYEQLRESMERPTHEMAGDERPRPPSTRLRRSWSGHVIGGVCAGLARSRNLDVVMVRILAVLGLIFFNFIFVLAYLVFWAMLPLHTEDLDESASTGLDREQEEASLKEIILFALPPVAIAIIAVFCQITLLPSIIELYTNLSAPLPWAVQKLLNLSDLISALWLWGPLLLGFSLLILFYANIRSRTARRRISLVTGLMCFFGVAVIAINLYLILFTIPSQIR